MFALCLKAVIEKRLMKCPQLGRLRTVSLLCQYDRFCTQNSLAKLIISMIKLYH